MKTLMFTGLAFMLSACAPSAPTQQFASENGISLKYTAWDDVPTLTAEAREKAIQHCAKYGKVANYKGGNAVSALSAEEVHQFACENTKTDESAILAAQSRRPAYIPVPSYQPPSQTTCTTVGTSTNCYSY